MKQHITPKQLNELSENGKDKLRKWWKPQGNEFLYTPEYEMGTRTKKWSVMQNCDAWAEDWERYKKDFEWCRLALPLLSIGQMVEFLGKDWAKLTLKAWEKPMGPLAKCPPPWAIDVPSRVLGRENLCNNLWEAVKEVLEK